MSVILRPVALSDLNMRFARDMGNGKVRHYLVSAMLQIIKHSTGQKPFDLVKEFIEKTEGIKDVTFQEYDPTEDIFDFGPSASFDANGIADIPPMVATEQYGAFHVADASTIVLSKNHDVGRALMKVKSNQMLHVRQVYPSLKDKYKTIFAQFYNSKVLPSLNRLLSRMQGADPYLLNPFIRQLKYMNEASYVRHVDVARFISVAFEASNVREASQALLDDLKTLHKQKLILGHFAMPKMMQLADNIGMNRKYFVLFCFPVIDGQQLLKATGKSSELELPHTDVLKIVGVKYETNEGSVSWLNGRKPEMDLEIEEVYVSDSIQEECRKQVIESYNATRDFINTGAKRAKTELDKWEKIESKSQDVFTEAGRCAGLAIDVKLKNKETGEIAHISHGSTQFSKKVDSY